ncbi:MAG: nucleoside deaminase [Ignavibacteria bacterium]|nr:nucleoside deaminase [Ignavibacteria bacterium]
MLQAIELSVSNIREGGGPFGAVIVKDGKVISRGANRVTKKKDPSAHAEIEAIREACEKLGTHDLSGCVIYSSCEPCPMCLAAIYWARLDRLYFAATKHDAAEAGFRDDFIYEEISAEIDKRKLTAVNMLADEARKAFEEWKLFDGKKEY